MEEPLMSNPFDTKLNPSLLLALVGILLTTFIGYLIGTLIEHPVGQGGLPFICAMVGALLALDILILGEALKSRK